MPEASLIHQKKWVSLWFYSSLESCMVRLLPIYLGSMPQWTKKKSYFDMRYILWNNVQSLCCATQNVLHWRFVHETVAIRELISGLFCKKRKVNALNSLMFLCCFLSPIGAPPCICSHIRLTRQSTLCEPYQIFIVVGKWIIWGGRMSSPMAQRERVCPSTPYGCFA